MSGFGGLGFGGLGFGGLGFGGLGFRGSEGIGKKIISRRGAEFAEVKNYINSGGHS